MLDLIVSDGLLPIFTHPFLCLRLSYPSFTRKLRSYTYQFHVLLLYGTTVVHWRLQSTTLHSHKPGWHITFTDLWFLGPSRTQVVDIAGTIGRESATVGKGIMAGEQDAGVEQVGEYKVY